MPVHTEQRSSSSLRNHRAEHSQHRHSHRDQSTKRSSGHHPHFDVNLDQHPEPMWPDAWGAWDPAAPSVGAWGLAAPSVGAWGLAVEWAAGLVRAVPSAVYREGPARPKAAARERVQVHRVPRRILGWICSPSHRRASASPKWVQTSFHADSFFFVIAGASNLPRNPTCLTPDAKTRQRD
jgi:hypothetical protein